MTLSGKSNLILGENKAAFRREGHIYRPPNTNSGEALTKLNSIFEQLRQITRSEFVCLGDFNIDLLKPSKDRKSLYEILSENGLEQLIKKPTRQTTKTNTLLDLIITNSNCVLDSGILYNNISDHYQVYLTRKHTKKQKHPSHFLGRNYSNYNKLTLENNLDLIDWTQFGRENNPNMMWTIYLQNITKHIDTLYPIRNFNINQQKDPWINDEIMHMIIEKDRLLSQAKLLNTEQAWERAKQAKNRTKNYIQRAKSNYISDSLETNKQNPKNFWRTINGILPNKKQSDNNILLKDQTTNEIVSDNDIPNFINTYFTSIGPKLAQNYSKTYQIIGPIGQEEFEFNLLTYQQVRDEIQKINIAKPSAIKLISTKILKDIFLYTCDKITLLYNRCIITSIFPDAWKIAMVTPLKKEGFKNNVSGLRPISILPLPGKVFEKLLHMQLYKYLDNKNLLSENQGGFRPKHSTQSTIAQFTDYIYTNINNNQITQSIFIDFSKAFDTVNYQILHTKMKYFLLKRNAIKILENYLTNRKQAVQINGKTSTLLDITCGVPQGSVLGPLLFLMYINDLEMFLKIINISQYADDTVISCSDLNQQKKILL